MKIAIITLPMRPANEVEAVIYPIEDNKTIEYEKPVRCPINGLLAKTLKKDDQVKIIYILTTGENSECEKNKVEFLQPLVAEISWTKHIAIMSKCKSNQKWCFCIMSAIITNFKVVLIWQPCFIYRIYLTKSTC